MREVYTGWTPPGSGGSRIGASSAASAASLLLDLSSSTSPVRWPRHRPSCHQRTRGRPADGTNTMLRAVRCLNKRPLLPLISSSSSRHRHAQHTMLGAASWEVHLTMQLWLQHLDGTGGKHKQCLVASSGRPAPVLCGWASGQARSSPARWPVLPARGGGDARAPGLCGTLDAPLSECSDAQLPKRLQPRQGLWSGP